MRKARKHFTPEEKVAILRRHLVDKVAVSELCEELGLRPTVFYMPSATVSWKPPDSNVRVAAGKLREERGGQPPRCRTPVK